MTLEWFNTRKAAQVVAFFACKEGRPIPVLKLAKLIYLSDRKHMERTGFPVLNDRLVSMPHGPVNSITLNYISGMQDADNHDWNTFVKPRVDYSVGAAKKFEIKDFDELSNEEIISLEVVWKLFGHMKKYEIRDWTHENCPEWEDPLGSSTPIPHERVMKYLSVTDAETFADEIEVERRIDEVFASLR